MVVPYLTPIVSDPHNYDQAERFRAAIDAIKADEPAQKVMSILNDPG